MTRDEIRASSILASVFALRMLGLFLIYPVFAVYAKSLPGGGDATLVGWALGIFGGVQAFLQVPFGMLSDRYGRKPVIIGGLVIFAIGAFVAAAASNIYWVIFGRAIQGLGAISAAITALIADATREEHRTKAMAMVGGSIGLSFALSMVLAPVLYGMIGMPGIFALIGVLAIAAIVVVALAVPDFPIVKSGNGGFKQVLANRELLRLDYGVFALHLTQVAMFVVVPSAIVQYVDLPVAQHWKIYLPVMFASFVLMLPPIFVGEKRGKMKQVFVGAIALLLAVQLGMWAFLAHPGGHGTALVVLLFAFFVAFNILEASQPSLVSRIAPPAAKGAALGVYGTLQSLGMFCGGAVGGVLRQHVGPSSVFACCAALTLVWLIIAASMNHVARRASAARDPVHV